LYTKQLPPEEGIGKTIYYASLRCRRGSDSVFLINGKKVYATKFEFICSYKTLNVKVASVPVEGRFARDEVERYWLAKNIGIVQREWTPPIYLDIDSNTKVDRYRFELFDFSIK